MRKVSVRNILAHKLRLMLTLLAVVLGTAFIAGSFMFTNSLSQTFDSAVSNAFTGVDVAVSKSEDGPILDQEMRDEIAADDQVGNVNMESSQTIVVANEDAEAFQTGGGTSSLTLYYPPEQSVGEPGEIVEGNAPSGENHVVINDSAAEQYGIAVGDELVVVHPDKRDTMTVDGIVKPAVDQGSAIILQMAEPDFVDKYGNSERLKVSGAEGVDPDELVDHLNATYDVEAESGEKLAEEMADMVSSALQFVNYFLIAFGLIALLVGTFIIANTFSMIVAQRTKEFALLRALGASRRQITNSVVVESVLVGLVAPPSVWLPAWVWWPSSSSHGRPRHAVDSGLGLSVSAVVVPLLLGTVVTVISAWAPARRAGAVEPVEAMRTTESAAGSSLLGRTIVGGIMMVAGIAFAIAGAVLSDAETSTRAILVGLGAFGLIVGFFLAGPALSLPIAPVLGKVIGKPFGAIGALASTNAKRNPRRTAATAFALTLGVALVTAIGMLGATMKSSVDGIVDETISSDYLLTGPTSGNFPTPNETPDAAREAEGAGEVIALSTAPATVDGQASMAFGPHSMSMVADGNPGNVVQLDIAEGDADLDATPGFLATTDFAAEHGWQVGESYPLAGPTGQSVDAELVGTFEPNNVIENMVIAKSLADEVVPPGASNIAMVGVNAEEGFDLEQLRTNLEESVKDLVVVQVMSSDEFAGQAGDLIDQMLAILYALLALAVIIAVLGIVNTLTLGVIERRQEIGMLRAVGTQRRQVRTMITLEAVQIAIFGAVMGMLMGLGLGWAFIEVLSGEGLEQATVPWGQLAIILVGSAVVGVVAAIWPAQRAAKTPPLDAIAD
ncbi:ABC transporter permease [Corynebacterium camporealensis]|uniref:ABC transporter permease n=1 Tax=Corynebacterium camporealensis TaxID=161896 RepID=UPI002011AE3C|nr:ABC transporter permease [Corynebacterium camporealensis]